MQEQANIELLKQVFASAEKLDATAVDHQLSPDFEMHSNDVHWDFDTYKQFHIDTYPLRKSIKVDVHDMLAQGDKVAGRVSITIVDLKDIKKEIEVMFIAHVKDGKVTHLWELTFPHWT